MSRTRGHTISRYQGDKLRRAELAARKAARVSDGTYGDCVNVKVRHVKFRLMSTSGTGRYEAKIIGRREANIWDVLATTRGHETSAEAVAAILKLADRRGIKVTDDPRALRMIEYRDRYGDLSDD